MFRWLLKKLLSGRRKTVHNLGLERAVKLHNARILPTQCRSNNINCVH